MAQQHAELLNLDAAALALDPEALAAAAARRAEAYLQLGLPPERVNFVDTDAKLDRSRCRPPITLGPSSCLAEACRQLSSLERTLTAAHGHGLALSPTFHSWVAEAYLLACLKRFKRALVSGWT